MKHPGGRPPHAPTAATRQAVEMMAAAGIPSEDVARVLGITKPTLRKHYRAELDTASAKANAKVAQSLFKKATGDGPQAVTAAIFWLKTRARWKDTTSHEISGPNGGPIQTMDLTKLSNEQLSTLEGILGPLAASGDDDAAHPAGEGETGG